MCLPLVYSLYASQTSWQSCWPFLSTLQGQWRPPLNTQNSLQVSAMKLQGAVQPRAHLSLSVSLISECSPTLQPFSGPPQTIILPPGHLVIIVSICQIRCQDLYSIPYAGRKSVQVRTFYSLLSQGLCGMYPVHSIPPSNPSH